MRKAMAGIVAGGALLMGSIASPAAADPNPRACENPQPHGTERAHATVPHDNEQAHTSIPHFCHH